MLIIRAVGLVNSIHTVATLQVVIDRWVFDRGL